MKGTYNMREKYTSLKLGIIGSYPKTGGSQRGDTIISGCIDFN
jgi:hypothetical protein